MGFGGMFVLVPSPADATGCDGPVANREANPSAPGHAASSESEHAGLGESGDGARILGARKQLTIREAFYYL